MSLNYVMKCQYLHHFITFRHRAFFKSVDSVLHAFIILFIYNYSCLPEHNVKNIVLYNIVSCTLLQDIRRRAFNNLCNLKILVMDNMSELRTLRGGVFDGLINLQSLFCSYNYKLYMVHRWAFSGKHQVRRMREVQFILLFSISVCI